VGSALAALCAGCASRQILHDGGSVSFGPSNAGALLAATMLPASGPGYRVPALWRRRGLSYGTEELVGLIAEVGEAIARDQAGRALAVADLSLPHGGPSAWHRSHQTGRDVDLVFFVRDERGRPTIAETMRRFGADGRSLPELGPDRLPLPTVVFDDAANWRLVRALVESSVAEVQYAFILDDLKQRLIDHAVAIGEDAALIAAASVLLRQPIDSAPHDDHLHVRILCSRRDRQLGCQDAGDVSWRKKGWKYPRPPARASIAAR
jgi:penicillin-insensitive murein DD-endopeptidase